MLFAFGLFVIAGSAAGLVMTVRSARRRMRLAPVTVPPAEFRQSGRTVVAGLLLTVGVMLGFAVAVAGWTKLH